MIITGEQEALLTLAHQVMRLAEKQMLQDVAHIKKLRQVVEAKTTTIGSLRVLNDSLQARILESGVEAEPQSVERTLLKRVMLEGVWLPAVRKEEVLLVAQLRKEMLAE